MAGYERSGFSTDGPAAIDRWLSERYVEGGKLPGCLLHVWHRGALVHQGMSGLVDVEQQRPMHNDAIFRVHSMTKMVTAAALLSLIEEGRLNLYDRVSDHIPSWSGLKVLENGQLVPPRRPMTIHDLARHTSGLSGRGMGAEVREMYRARDIPRLNLPGGLDSLVEELSALPLEFHPGEYVTYSIGMWVLGYIIQKVGGKPLGEVLRERIFDPLKMTDTGFFSSPDKAHRLAPSYRWTGSAYVPDFEHDFTRPPLAESADGGLLSTASDFMRFCRMLLNGGSLDGAQILSPKSVELLRINHLPGNKDVAQMAAPGAFVGWPVEGIGISICCGTTIDIVRRQMPGSTGTIFWSGAANCHPLIDPSEDLAIVFMAQVKDTPFFFDLMRSVYTMVYGSLTS